MAGTRNYDFLVSTSTAPDIRHPSSAELRASCQYLNLLDQAAPYWRLGSRQVVLPAALQRRLVHAILHNDDWHRLQNPDHRARRQAREAADMGHGRPGTVPDHHDSVLQGRHGHTTGLRCHR